MTQEKTELALKRREMSRESWIKNVMRIYPEKTRKETEILYQNLFELDNTTADLPAPEHVQTEDVTAGIIASNGLQNPEFETKE